MLLEMNFGPLNFLPLSLKEVEEVTSSQEEMNPRGAPQNLRTHIFQTWDSDKDGPTSDVMHRSKGFRRVPTTEQASGTSTL